VLQLNRSDADKATCVTEGRESCTERARQYADEDKGSGYPPDHPTRSAAEEYARSAHQFGSCRLLSALCLRPCAALDGARR